MAIVAEGPSGRVYLPPNAEHENAALIDPPLGVPEAEINHNPRDIRAQLYGLTKYRNLFTSRQLMALKTCSDLIQVAINKIKTDAVTAGMASDARGLDAGDRKSTRLNSSH